MSAGYYERTGAIHLDGTPIFQTAGDRQSETDVAAMVAAAFACDIHHFGDLSPIDWYAVRSGRIVGVLELKSRAHEERKYPTVFLNVRKWLALSLASVGLNVPAIFVAKFVDGVRWIKVPDVDASRVKIGGTKHIVKSSSDIEPLIEVPIASMVRLQEPKA